MDTEKLNNLRSSISIPLNRAIQLLKKNDGDVKASEKEFHLDNIREISIAAACDEEIAEKYYNECRYDIAKAIEKINALPIMITTRENPSPRNEIGFILWPMSADWKYYKTEKRNDAFIPTADFDHIINEFRSVFPVHYPDINYDDDGFDVCGHNYFDNADCRKILERIRHSETEDPAVKKFKNDLVNWLNDKLQYADYIVVYGNL
ncbi:hypothetical protein [Chryseobacterium sp. 2987]|uniref:hypothetical protein n=1 Tax=Chryseobacterium sp. 2987 TaxID=2817767 RepID=UPI00285FC247|nr:hypothetical protein [Chryseobacterium sp. 2987]MDR6919710.1 hypothetical protein [Chryseobacterium sp. 2987]